METTKQKDYQAIVAMDSFMGIGKDNNIPWDNSEDLKKFYKITTNCKEGKINMVVMGRKTWDSIPDDKKPLKKRINVVMSRSYTDGIEKVQDDVFGISEPTLVDELVNELDIDKVFIIGGEEIYRLFAPRIERTYVTRVQGDYGCDTFWPAELRGSKLGVHHDKTYLQLLKKVLDTGDHRTDRTGTGTISLFAPDPLRFDVSKCVPLLTTKKMAWKGVIKELLWFLRGDTDARILQKQGVHIWDGNSSREFLDNRGLSYEEGVLGSVYGWQFRRFGAEYDECYADSRNITPEIAKELGGVDQLAYVETLLKTDPFSRRIYMNLWNAADLDKMALTPCHCGIQFYVVGGKGEHGGDDKKVQKELSCHVYIRSNDLFLGNPYNIFSYAVLLYIMAKRCNMKPKELIISFGDAHIYTNHLEQVALQLSREPFPSPRLEVSDTIATKDWSEIDISDFDVLDYECYPAIRGVMSV